MGGALAFAVAEKVPAVTAAIALYGTLEPLAGHLIDETDGRPFFQVNIWFRFTLSGLAS